MRAKLWYVGEEHKKFVVDFAHGIGEHHFYERFIEQEQLGVYIQQTHYDKFYKIANAFSNSL
jgi:hypothetical protein